VITDNDKSILRKVGEQYAEAAASPRNRENIRLWKCLNRGKMERPMVNIDQFPYHELNEGGVLDCLVSDPFWRGYEQRIRRELYKWNNCPGDMVLDPFFKIPMAINDSGYGLSRREELLLSDAKNDVVSHKYNAVLDNDADIENIKDMVITHDEAETSRRIGQAVDIFGDIAPVRAGGYMFHLGLWDEITCLMGVENCYIRAR